MHFWLNALITRLDWLLPLLLYLTMLHQCTRWLLIWLELHILNTRLQMIRCFVNTMAKEGDLGWTQLGTPLVSFQGCITGIHLTSSSLGKGIAAECLFSV